MSLESVAARREKRIVEHIITGFNSAREAIIFGSTLERVVVETLGKVKFQISIGAPDTKLAITEGWTGKTVLKTIFLEIKNQNTAISIVEAVKKTVSSYEETHKTLLHVANETVREKPQPQFIG